MLSGQREAVSDFLVALTREMQPAALLPLLRKLTIDVSKLSEYTTVALRLLTLHYERCGKYYGASAATPGTATEEEKRLTMMLFTNIFESLSKMEYDPELFGKALPCLSAIGCSLPPDYSLTTGYEDDLYNVASSRDGPYSPQPIDSDNVELDSDLTELVSKFSEHYHDAWAARKMENGWNFGETWNDDVRTHPRWDHIVLCTFLFLCMYNAYVHCFMYVQCYHCTYMLVSKSSYCKNLFVYHV